MVVVGHAGTVPVTMDAMMHHAAAVSTGASRAPVVGDLPFSSAYPRMHDAVRGAGRLGGYGGGQAVRGVQPLHV